MKFKFLFDTEFNNLFLKLICWNFRLLYFPDQCQTSLIFQLFASIKCLYIIHCENLKEIIVNWYIILNFNPLNPAGRFSGLRKQGPRNPAGRFSGIWYGVSKTRRAFKPVHVRLTIKWFVYTGRYQATLGSQVESSSLFSFLTICNLLTGFCTRYTNLRRKYGGDTQCMWRYRYSLHVMDNVEELYKQKIGFWDRNGGIHGTC